MAKRQRSQKKIEYALLQIGHLEKDSKLKDVNHPMKCLLLSEAATNIKEKKIWWYVVDSFLVNGIQIADVDEREGDSWDNCAAKTIVYDQWLRDIGVNNGQKVFIAVLAQLRDTATGTPGATAPSSLPLRPAYRDGTFRDGSSVDGFVRRMIPVERAISTTVVFKDRFSWKSGQGYDCGHFYDEFQLDPRIRYDACLQMFLKSNKGWWPVPKKHADEVTRDNQGAKTKVDDGALKIKLGLPQFLEKFEGVVPEIWVMPQHQGCTQMWNWSSNIGRMASDFISSASTAPPSLYIEVHLMPAAKETDQQAAAEDDPAERSNDIGVTSSERQAVSAISNRQSHSDTQSSSAVPTTNTTSKQRRPIDERQLSDSEEEDDDVNDEPQPTTGIHAAVHEPSDADDQEIASAQPAKKVKTSKQAPPAHASKRKRAAEDDTTKSSGQSAPKQPSERAITDIMDSNKSENLKSEYAEPYELTPTDSNDGFPTGAQIKRYFATRFSTLRPPMDKVQNPIKVLSLLNRKQWLNFLVAFVAWTWDAFDFFTVSLTVTQLAATFGKSKADITWGITLVLMFRSVGAIIFGLAADRFGRKWPFVVNNVLFIVLELGTGFCNTYEQFLAVRALFGIAMGGLYGNAAATALEDCPQPARGIVSGMLQQGYAFGYLLATVFARALVDTTPHGWRPYFWFAACPPVLIIIFRLCLPETDSFIARQAVRASQPNIGTTFLREGKVALARHWPILIYLVLLMAGFNFMSHGSQDLYPTFLSSQLLFSANQVTVTQVVANLGAISGGTLIGYFSQMLGRRFSIIYACILGGALIYPYCFVSNNSIIAAAFFEQAFVQGAWGVIPIHLMELSPPSFRTFVVGTSYQLGNLVSSASSTIEATIGERFPLAPLVAANGTTTPRYNYGIVMAIFMGCVYGYVILLTFLGPEFKNRDMGIEHDRDLQIAAGHDAVDAVAHGHAHRTDSDDIEKA